MRPPLDLPLPSGRRSPVGMLLDMDDITCSKDAGGAAAFAMFVFGMATDWIV